MPEAETKTDMEYTWLFDRKFSYYITALQKACKVLDREQLENKIEYAFKTIMAEVQDCSPKEVQYQMRSLRCTIATKYLQLCTECEIKNWAKPPNPLQHIRLQTTREHYAANNAEYQLEARERLAKRGINL